MLLICTVVWYFFLVQTLAYYRVQFCPAKERNIPKWICFATTIDKTGSGTEDVVRVSQWSKLVDAITVSLSIIYYAYSLACPSIRLSVHHKLHLPLFSRFHFCSEIRFQCSWNFAWRFLRACAETLIGLTWITYLIFCIDLFMINFFIFPKSFSKDTNPAL